MKNMTVVALGTCALSLMFSSYPGSIVSFAQKTTKDRVCKASVLAASKPLPVLRYPCGSEGTDDSDEKILKQPQRIRALEKLEQRLGTFTSASWWQADVDDLNICQLRGKAGPLNEEEKERLAHGDYLLSLWGNSSFRLVLTPDPCYQTGYGGSNAFLLYRGRGRVVVSKVLDGYFSRADNSLGLDFANSKPEQIIEISTGTGGLNPEVTNYYFMIDPRNSKAAPEKIFKDDKGLTNRITSAMLMSEPEDLDLPADAGQLKVIRQHKLAPSFSIYKADTDGKIDDNGRQLTRKVWRWNGRFYEEER